MQFCCKKQDWKWILLKHKTLDHLICNHFSRKAQKSGLINLVQEIWFEKNSSWIFFLVREKWLTKKKVGLYYKSTISSGWRKMVQQTQIFFWFEKSGWPDKKFELEEPLFYIFLEKWLQNKWLIIKRISEAIWHFLYEAKLEKAKNVNFKM